MRNCEPWFLYDTVVALGVEGNYFGHDSGSCRWRGTVIRQLWRRYHQQFSTMFRIEETSTFHTVYKRFDKPLFKKNHFPAHPLTLFLQILGGPVHLNLRPCRP